MLGLDTSKRISCGGSHTSRLSRLRSIGVAFTAMQHLRHSLERARQLLSQLVRLANRRCCRHEWIWYEYNAIGIKGTDETAGLSGRSLQPPGDENRILAACALPAIHQ